MHVSGLILGKDYRPMQMTHWRTIWDRPESDPDVTQFNWSIEVCAETYISSTTSWLCYCKDFLPRAKGKYVDVGYIVALTKH